MTCDSTSAMTSWTSETRALCAAALALTRALRDATMSSLRATACGSREDVVSLLAALSTNRERGRGGANARARAISGRSDARVDVVVARDATRANAGNDGRRKLIEQHIYLRGILLALPIVSGFVLSPS